MELNKNVKLIHRDIHLYDIEACHYTILKNTGFDVSGLDINDKLGRNIKIGQMMKDNPRLTSLLRNTTESVINDYINKNRIKDDEIIIRQYDGLILTRTLSETNVGHIPLERRTTYQIFIISIERKKYIALDNNFDVTVKGVPFLYNKMNEMYKQLCTACDMNKTSMFKYLQRIKDKILTSNDTKLYGIPTKNDKYIIFLKDYGEIEITKPTIKIIDSNDIDRQKYYNLYIEPFAKSIVVEFIRRK